jgi:L-ascorbate metabolism protein UlaG (beta-lactamase superfamily)
MGDMRIRKFGHSCVLLEEGDARLLVDPGAFSSGFESLTNLTAVLLTHQHADHLDVDRLVKLLDANPDAVIRADVASAAQLDEAGVSARADVQTAVAGQELILGGVSVAVAGTEHAVIHPDIPIIPNVGYLVAGTFYYPGDSFTPPPATDGPLPVLGLPVAAPWLKVSESIEFLRAVSPRVAVPMHDAVVSAPATGLYYGLYGRFADEQGTELRVLGGDSVDL